MSEQCKNTSFFSDLIDDFAIDVSIVGSVDALKTINYRFFWCENNRREGVIFSEIHPM